MKSVFDSLELRCRLKRHWNITPFQNYGSATVRDCYNELKKIIITEELQCWRPCELLPLKVDWQLHVRVIALERWKMTLFFTVFSQNLGNYDRQNETSSCWNTLYKAYICLWGSKFFLDRVTKCIAFEKQKNNVLTVFSQYLENYNRENKTFNG